MATRGGVAAQRCVSGHVVRRGELHGDTKAGRERVCLLGEPVEPEQQLCCVEIGLVFELDAGGRRQGRVVVREVGGLVPRQGVVTQFVRRGEPPAGVGRLAST